MARGDEGGLAYARLGLIRAKAPSSNLPVISADLQRQLDSDLMKRDLRLRFFCLSIKADIDGEMQSDAMQRDWEQIAWLARLLKDAKWEYRAAAGLGMTAFYRGDIATARKKIVGALLSAMAAHDVGSEVKYLYAIGNGLTATKQYGDALEYLDEAIKLSQSTTGAPYPFMMYVIKAEALASRSRQVCRGVKDCKGCPELRNKITFPFTRRVRFWRGRRSIGSNMIYSVPKRI